MYLLCPCCIQQLDWLGSCLCKVPVHNDSLCTSKSARWLFHLKAKYFCIPTWAFYYLHSSICWLVFSASSRWSETASLWDVLGSCGIGHSHSSGHSCCPGSYSPSKKKKGNSIWVREFLLALLKRCLYFFPQCGFLTDYFTKKCGLSIITQSVCHTLQKWMACITMAPCVFSAF